MITAAIRIAECTIYFASRRCPFADFTVHRTLAALGLDPPPLRPRLSALQGLTRLTLAIVSRRCQSVHCPQLRKWYHLDQQSCLGWKASTRRDTHVPHPAQWYPPSPPYLLRSTGTLHRALGWSIGIEHSDLGETALVPIWLRMPKDKPNLRSSPAVTKPGRRWERAPTRWSKNACI